LVDGDSGENMELSSGFKISRNKKGIFFTLIAIALVSLLLINFTAFSISNENNSVNRRVSTMNNFVKSLEEDVQRKMYISGFRTIFIYEKRILESGNYILDPSGSFEELFFNGTIERKINEDEATLVSGITLLDIEYSLNLEADKVNLKVSLNNASVLMTQNDPWNVRIELGVDLKIEDLGNLASWENHKTFVSYIPISNFEDPIYLVNTGGKISPKVVRTPYTTFSNGGDVSNLLDHVTKKYYLNSTSAPSFLKRLKGDFSVDENGIESLVYLPDLSAQGITLKDKSIVDYIYFSTSNPSSSGVVGMPSWFKLDGDAKARYGV